MPGGLRVRMGLHTGDAVARDGDYYGPATNRAARVMAAAHGGQVVVSHATEEILRDALPDEIALVDLGEHRLPDLARPERIFQVVAAGLGREFPPLRSLDAVPGNLPGQFTSFVGRTIEREAIADALLTSRLVTVTGVGGVGKSRIANASGLKRNVSDENERLRCLAENKVYRAERMTGISTGVRPKTF